MENVPKETASIRKRKRKKKTNKNQGKSANQSNSSLSSKNEELYSLLHSQRYELSQKNGVPQYVVAPNKTLTQIAEIKPQSKEAMLQINGMGPNRFRLYGKYLLETVQRYGN